MAVVQFAVFYGLGARGGWFADDFVTLSQAQSSGLDPRYLASPIFSHPIPGTRLVNWLLFRIAPMNYPVAYLLPVVALVLTGYLVHRTLTVLTGPSWATVGFAVVVGSAAIWLPSAMWFAAGPQMLFSSLAGVLTIHAVAHCYRSGTRSGTAAWGALAATWTVAGLAFYEIVTMVSVGGLVLTVIAVTESFRLSALLSVVRRAWAAFVLVPAVVIAYLVVYLSRDYVGRQPGYTVASVGHFILDSWLYTLAPGLLGGSLAWTYGAGGFASTATPGWWMIAVQACVVLLVIVTVWRGGWRAAAAWALLLVVFGTAQFVVASARLHIYGLAISRETRYTADAIAFSALCIGVAVLGRPRRSALRAAVETGGGRLPAFRWSARARRAVIVLPAVAVVTSGVSTVAVTDHWVHNSTQTYLSNFRRSLATAQKDPRFSVYNTVVRSDLVDPAFFPYADVGSVATLFAGRPVSVDDANRHLYVVDRFGTLRRATFVRRATVGDHCWHRTGPRGALRISLHPVHPDSRGRLFLRFRYTGSAGSHLRLHVVGDAAPGRRSGDPVQVPTAGSGQAVIALPDGPATNFELAADGAGTCISDAQIGTPRPR